jgi:hypothetical protein
MKSWRYARPLLIEAQKRYDLAVRARWARWRWVLAVCSLFSREAVENYKVEREEKHKHTMAVAYDTARKVLMTK